MSITTFASQDVARRKQALQQEDHELEREYSETAQENEGLIDPSGTDRQTAADLSVKEMDIIQRRGDIAEALRKIRDEESGISHRATVDPDSGHWWHWKQHFPFGHISWDMSNYNRWLHVHHYEEQGSAEDDLDLDQSPEAKKARAHSSMATFHGKLLNERAPGSRPLRQLNREIQNLTHEVRFGRPGN